MRKLNSRKLAVNNLFFVRNGLIFLFLIIAILFGVYVNYTPYYMDDYTYKFFNAPDELCQYYVDIPLVSYYTDNFGGVSRFVPHLIIGIFHLLGKTMYDILSGIIFVLFGLTSARLATNDRKKFLPLAMISCGILFVIVNGFFQVSVWMSGAPNYIYPAILVSLFIILLKTGREIVKNRILNFLLLFLFGMVTGWTNEGFIIGLTGSCLIYYGFIKRNEVNMNRLILISGLFIGCCCLSLTPFNVSRFMAGHGDLSVGTFIHQLLSSILYLNNLRILPFLVIIMIIGIAYLKITKFKHPYRWIKCLLSSNMLIVLALSLSLIFLLLTRHTSVNSRFPLEFYCLLLLLIIICRLPEKYLNIMGCVSGITVTILLISIVPVAKLNYESYNDIEAQIKEKRPVIISSHIPCADWQKRYVIPPYEYLYPFTGLTAKDVTCFYGNESNPFIIDENIYSEINSTKENWKAFHREEWRASYVKVPEDKEVKSVKLYLSPVDFDKISFPTRWIARYMDKYQINEISDYEFETIEINGEKWLLIADNISVTDRLQKIELTLE